MSTATPISTADRMEPPSLGAAPCVMMSAVGWAGYRTLLRLRGDRPRPRMIYLDGDAFLMSPAFPHEELAELLGVLVLVVVEELGIPCRLSGSTTFRRRSKGGGAEADKSFYLANAPRVLGKRTLHLRSDPPPDLVIEAVNTHAADAAVEVWRRFGVPEVWVADGATLQIQALQPDGQYSESLTSVAFPLLHAAEIHEWVTRPDRDATTAWLKALRRWVAEVLAPRTRDGREGRP